MNKKKTIILLVIGILIVTKMSIGVTYSYMKPKVTKDSNETEIGINNCAKITLKDNNSTLNLTNMYPMEEEMGLQTEAYEFTISSTCEDYTGFNLYLLTYSDNGIADNLIRYAITGKNNTILETDLLTNKKEETSLTEKEQEEINQGINKGYSKIYKIYSNNIPLKGESEYKLHIWLDENDDNTTMGKNIKLGVIVKGYSREETMAEYLIAHKDNNLIYHDGKPDYEGEENYNLEAGDLSYRYSGASEEVNNFVCLDGINIENKCASDTDLYRIIGLFKNDENNYEMKLIKYDYATKTELGDSSIPNSAYVNKIADDYYTYAYYKGTNFQNVALYSWNNKDNYNSTNDWSQSNLNTENLNKFYYNYITKKAPNIKITYHEWSIGAAGDMKNIHEANALIAYSYDVGENSEKVFYQNYIGLIYISDYYYSANNKYWSYVGSNTKYSTPPKYDGPFDDYRDAKGENWIYMGLIDNTISRNNAYNSSNYRWSICFFGHFCGNLVYDGRGVRPSFYLSANTELSTGDGSYNNPFRLSL